MWVSIEDILRGSVHTAAYVQPLVGKLQSLLARAPREQPYPAPGAEVAWLEALVQPPSKAPKAVKTPKAAKTSKACAPAAAAAAAPSALTSELLSDFVVHMPRLTPADVDAELARFQPGGRL